MTKDYNQWYLSIGLRKKVNFLNPLIIDGNTFFLPKNSTLHFNTFSENLAGPTSKDFLFAAERKVVVNNMLKYSGAPIGNFRLASGVNSESVSRKLKLERGKNSIVFADKANKVSDTELLVYNYNSLLSSYIYTNHPVVLFYKWNNTMDTIVNNINNNLENTRRNQFLLLEIPNSIPKKDTLIEKSKKEDMNKQTLEIFNTYKLLMLLDIWKYLNLDLHYDSKLSKIDSNKLHRVNILFKYKNKYIVLNMAVLFHMANLYSLYDKMELPDNKKEYDVSISKLDFKQARAALILLFNKAIENGAMSFAELEQGNTDASNLKMANGALNLTVLKATNARNDDDVELDEDLLEEMNNDYSAPISELPDITISEKEDEEEDIDGDFNFDSEEDNDLEEELKSVELTAMEEEVDEDFNTLESIMIEDKTQTRNSILEKIKKASSNGEISKNMSDNLLNIVENMDQLPSPYIGEDRFLGEMLDVKKEDILLKDEEFVIPAISFKDILNSNKIDKKTRDIILDYSKDLEIYNKEVLKPLTKHYVEKLHKRYLVSSVYKMQEAGLIMTDYKVTVDEDSLGAYELHTFETTTLKGKKNKNTIKLPTLNSAGQFNMSGNTYSLRKQSGDIPIRKIDFNKVVLSSYFGKLFITKADSKLKDFGYWLSKQISLMGTLGDWSTRPESNKAFKNTIVTDLKENDRFRRGDAIAYNVAFFQKDYLFKNKLIYKMATYANVGLTEEEVTKEDSSVVSKDMYRKLVTNIYNTQGFIFKASDVLIDIPKEKTKLKPDTYLYTLMNNNLSEDVQLSNNVIESLQEIKNNSAVAGKEGTLDFVEIYYNAFIDDLSDSFKDLLKNKKLVKKASQVTNQYSVDGRPLAKGEVHMVFYIASEQEAGGGEKIVAANQLKSIIGDVVDYKIVSKGGIEVDMLFSKLSVENRVVNSAYIMGTANLLLDEEAKELLKIWNS